jgi:hypothetical protein
LLLRFSGAFHGVVRTPLSTSKGVTIIEKRAKDHHMQECKGDSGEKIALASSVSLLETADSSLLADLSIRDPSGASTQVNFSSMALFPRISFPNKDPISLAGIQRNISMAQEKVITAF